MFESKEAREIVLREHLTDKDFITNRRPTSKGRSVIFDFDSVCNMYSTYDPTKNYLLRLSDGRLEKIHEKKEELFGIVPRLEKGGDPVYLGNLISEILKDGNLTKRTHEDICKEVSDEFIPAKNLKKTIDELVRKGYVPYILSASPKELVKFCIDKNEIEIKDENIYSTDFVFDEKEKFVSMELNLGKVRKSKRDLISEKNPDEYGLEVMIDDNPVTGKNVLKPGCRYVNVWLNNKSVPVNDNLNIVDDLVRDDFSILSEKLEKIDRGLDVVNGLDERIYTESIKCIHSAVKYGEAALKSGNGDFIENKGTFVIMLKAYDVKMGDVSFYDRKIRSKISEINLEDRKIMCKKKIKEVVEILDEKCLESRLDSSLLEEYLHAS